MLIMPNKISFKPITLQAKQLSNLPKLKTLNKDTVSFGYIDAPRPSKDLQLYRCIGESELNALLEGKTIGYGNYATSDPRGWGARNWHNGFTNHEKNTYFITFKTGDENFEMRDRRDSYEEYNLDNIQNIRKGHNVHGELVWAEDFENAKRQDKENKLSEIDRLINNLKELSDTNDTNDTKINEIYDELGSYAKEFPNIIDRLKPISENNEEQTGLFFGVIADANRPRDWSFVKNKLQDFLNNDICIDINPLFSYIGRYAQEEDCSMLLDIEKNDKISIDYLGSILNKFETPQSHSMIKERYLNGNTHTQYNLIDYFKGKEDRADIARFTLDKYKNQQDEILNVGDYNNSALISECVQILEKQGSKDDIPLLEEYTQGNSSYFNYEIKSAINKLNQQKKWGKSNLIICENYKKFHKINPAINSSGAL